MTGWIGVDLDGTLAKSVKAQTGKAIGAPIRPMVQLVKWWLAQGEDIRIFTACVNPNHHQGDIVHARRAIEVWCKRRIGQILPVTYEKDWDMVLLLDDRARQVERDTGRVFCRHPREDLNTYGYTISRHRRQIASTIRRRPPTRQFHFQKADGRWLLAFLLVAIGQAE